MIHKIFSNKDNWNIATLPTPFRSWNPTDATSSSLTIVSSYRKPAEQSPAKLNAFVIKALIEYAKGEKSSIALLKVSKGHYVTEHHLGGNCTYIHSLRDNGVCEGCVVGSNGQPSSVKNLKIGYDITGLMLCILAVMGLTDEEAPAGKLWKTAEADMKAYVSDPASAGFPANSAVEMVIRYLCDDVYYGLNNGNIKVNETGGNIGMLTSKTLTSEIFYDSQILCGEPSIIDTQRKVTYGTMAFSDAKAVFKKFASKREWTKEETALIPVFADDYIVPPEAIKIARRYATTRNSKVPMTNFMWRGITSYGKSTGVELIAALLNMPLLRVTCHSTMETQDFLSNIVPVDSGDVSKGGEIPSFTDIRCDPVSSYYAITGEEKENATPDDCLQAIIKVTEERANSRQGKNLFKQVESNFVKALANGYIVEIQEISRIRDSGVLVGLNEYDRANAIIPLVNGDSVRRHPDAMVIYTDNVGYSSCRAIDPSVLRRMSFILDSYSMPKESVLARVKYNTGFANKDLLNMMYNAWQKVSEYCTEHEITEGTVSVTELERWAQCVMEDGYTNIKDNCIDCVVAKATSIPEEQNEIISSVVNICLG